MAGKVKNESGLAAFYGEVRGLRGVLATGETLEECRNQLAEVVEEWVLVRVAKGLSAPRLGKIAIRDSQACFDRPLGHE